jgi:hypothetical protein
MIVRLDAFGVEAEADEEDGKGLEDSLVDRDRDGSWLGANWCTGEENR